MLAMAPAPPPLPPMSPMGMLSPMCMSPTQLTPHAQYLSPSKQVTATTIAEGTLPSPVADALPSKSSLPANVADHHQRPSDPPVQAPASSGSASSSSDSGSDSGSDSSDDSEDDDDRPAAQPTKGPSTPPSVSPKLDNLVEEPPPAIEESKRRWDLSSFFNKTAAVQHGEQNPETKPAQVRLRIEQSICDIIETMETWTSNVESLLQSCSSFNAHLIFLLYRITSGWKVLLR